MPIELVEQYYQMIQHLNNADKMILAEKIIHSVNSNPEFDDNQSLFGAWQDNRSADEILQEIKSNRLMQRQIESF